MHVLTDLLAYHSRYSCSYPCLFIFVSAHILLFLFFFWLQWTRPSINISNDCFDLCSNHLNTGPPAWDIVIMSPYHIIYAILHLQDYLFTTWPLYPWPLQHMHTSPTVMWSETDSTSVTVCFCNLANCGLSLTPVGLVVILWSCYQHWSVVTTSKNS